MVFINFYSFSQQLKTKKKSNSDSIGNSISLGSNNHIGSLVINQTYNSPKCYSHKVTLPYEEVNSFENPLKKTLFKSMYSPYLSDSTKAQSTIYYDYLKRAHSFDKNKLAAIGEFVFTLSKEQDDSLSNLLTRLRSLTCSYVEIQNIDSNQYFKIKIDSAINANFEIYNFKNGFAKIRVGNKYGYVNTALKVVIDPLYDEVQDLFDSLATGYISHKSRATKTSDGYECYLLNLTNSSKKKLIYDHVYSMQNNLARVKIPEGYYSFIDKKLIPFADDTSLYSSVLEILNDGVRKKFYGYYKSASDFNYHLAAVEGPERLSYYINCKGNKVSQNYLTASGFYPSGYAVISTAGKAIDEKSYYFIDTSFHKSTSYYRYEPASIGEGIFTTFNGRSFGLVKDFGFEFVDFKYDTISQFVSGYAIVGIDSFPKQMLNEAGSEVGSGQLFDKYGYAVEEDSQERFMFVDRKRYKYNLINKYGAELIPGGFHNKIEFLAENIVLVSDGSKSMKWKLGDLGKAFPVE